MVSVHWDTVLMTSKTTPTLQVVVNPLLERKSPVSKQIFASLKQLEADYVRYVPWLPYPRLAVAELEPPSGPWLCTQLQLEEPDGWNASLSCTLGVIDKVHFASYGTPQGTCGNFTMGKCNAANTTAFVEKMCVGKKSCMFPVNTETFGDPCVGTAKTFAVQVTCNVSQNHTYWDFSVIDPMMEDFMTATANHTVIINFSTIPAWMYKTPSRVLYPDDPDREVRPGYTQGTDLVDPTGTQLGDYYGRLVSWYTKGGFKDEYGTEHQSGHEYTIPYWECLNEVEGEHRNTPESYTARYDEMVTGIRKMADPDHKITFVGLALAGRRTNFVSYFLNKSNHQPGIPLDFISYHFYAGSSNRTDPNAYEGFFTEADGFFTQVAGIEEIRKSLSPETRTTIDEIGVILPGDNSPNAPMFPPIYWNAAGSMYAYIFGKLSLQGIDVLGESQLVGYPALPKLNLEPQFPSVALLDWTTGRGTARYWVLHMLIHNFQMGDKLVETNVSTSTVTGNNPFCGSILNLDTLQLECTTPGAVISKIDFASYGTPSGSCLHYDVGSCNAANSTAIVEKYCVGKSSCTVPATTPIFGDPCFGTVKHLVVQAECSKGGGIEPNGTTGVYAQGFIDAKTQGKKLLLVNKGNANMTVTVPGAKGGSLVYVDETTIGQTDEVSKTIDADEIELLPFASGVVKFST
ncbi:uncharacterized protein [Oscarella lobularis]